MDEPYWNSSVAASMSQTYLQHFELLNQNGDLPGAFRILERIRGRTLASALEDKKALPAAESEQTQGLENDVSALQTRLLQANSVIEREQLLDKLVEYERRLGLAWTRGDAANQRFPVQPASLTKVEDDLNPDEVFLEYVLDDPHSFCLSISRKGAYLRVLPVGRTEIQKTNAAICRRSSGKRRGDRRCEAALRLAAKADSGNGES